MRSVEDNFTRSDWCLVGADGNKGSEIFMTKYEEFRAKIEEIEAKRKELSAKFEEADFIGQQSRLLSTMAEDRIDIIKEYGNGDSTREDVFTFYNAVSVVTERMFNNVNHRIEIQKNQGLKKSDAMNDFLSYVNSVVEENKQIMLLLPDVLREKDKIAQSKSEASAEKQKTPSP